MIATVTTICLVVLALSAALCVGRIVRGQLQRVVCNPFDQWFQVVATHVSDTPFRAGGAGAAWRGEGVS